ncbi:MAG: acetamidase/formamidase family protein [Firmicutes bacterium]|nr:acetamidase/formamidase family protein [Bacillota bacterium]
MPEVLFHVDPTKSMAEQDLPGHNRWHPDIPAEVAAKPGQDFRVECQEWTDGQIRNSDSAEDVRDVDLTRAHMLSGPIAIKGAEPGDLLVVDILDIGPLQPWGYTGIFARENGGGFLTDLFPDAYKAVWDFHGIYATSRHIPGVRFAGLSHPGLMGCAPSYELLAKWNARERALIATSPARVPPLALPPLADNALLGTLKGYKRELVAQEAARTIPPREHGGNVDIKNLSRGARIYFPVYVKDALLSVGDLHFSQGDGEITFCGAIEMAGWIDLGVDLIKGGMARYGITSPIFKPGPVEPRFSSYLMFEGISVENDTNYYLDATVAYRQAAIQAIEYLTHFGYTREQAYLLLGAAPVEGRIGGIVDIPNACVTIGIPTEIFERDIFPR